jgi:aryl-alcohol dehydrogenase-like predicted oxidoreductase
MRYKLLGRSGVRVSELCLGTMTFGETWGWGASKEESRKQVDMFAEAGGNFIDTSTNYTDGASEEFIGEFLHDNRDYWVLATKYTLTKSDSTDPNSGGNSRKNMRQTVERSLRRLQTDHIDILYLHMWDYLTPIEEIMRGLDDLVRSGKVNYVAVSDSPEWAVSAANMLAEVRGWSRFIGLQIPYALNRRDAERGLLPMAQHWDMAVLPWGVLGQGVLLGKYNPGSEETTRFDKERMPPLPDQTVAIVDAVARIAEETGHSKAQVCLNWTRQQPYQMIPILGARRADQLADNLACLEWTLSDEQLQQLNEVSKIEYGFPRDFLELGAKQFIYGNTFDLIDKHRPYPPR